MDADLLFADGVPPNGDLPLQACADQGRGLRQPFEEPPADIAQTRGRCAHRRRNRNRKRSLIISPRLAPKIWRSNGGAMLATKLCAARPSRRRSPTSAEPSRWRTNSERRTPGREAGDPVLSERRLRLHTDYGHAAMWSKGFAADEMSAAYARASKFAGPSDEAAPRFVAYYGECLRSFMRGEHHQAHAEAEAFLREAEAEGRPTEAGVARRVLGFVSLQLGDLQEARKALERALDDYAPERDRDALFRFGNDTAGQRHKLPGVDGMAFGRIRAGASAH